MQVAFSDPCYNLQHPRALNVLAWWHEYIKVLLTFNMIVASNLDESTLRGHQAASFKTVGQLPMIPFAMVEKRILQI